jgi:hypothetical protein
MADRSWSGRVGEATENVAAFSTAAPEKPWLDRPHIVLMVDIRFASGDSMAFQYFDLVSVRRVGEALKLHFHHATVTIRGRHLTELKEKLLEHKTYAIQEQHEAEELVPASKPYISLIENDQPELDTLSSKLSGQRRG